MTTPWDDQVFEPIRNALVQRMIEIGYADPSPEHAMGMMRGWDYYTDNALDDRGRICVGGIDPEVVRLLWRALYLHYGVEEPSWNV
jgi:hypothetical protein